MTGTDVDVLIIGGGIAGLAAAYFARTAGRRVLLIDSAVDCASLVPTAMINPVRGYRGRVSPADIDGARFTFELIETLRRNGHTIAAGRGVWRPVPDAATRAEWSRLLAGVAHRWVEPGAAPDLLEGHWSAVLYLPDSGWVESQTLLAALRAGADAEWLAGTVATIDAQGRRVTLADGSSLSARALLWTGGASGAARFASSARYRPGSVLISTTRLAPYAVSYGLYSAPYQGVSVIGPTTEAMFKEYREAARANAAAEAALEERARATLPVAFAVAARWRGVRLESALMPAGLAVLGPFGSRGFLLAPQAAQRWAGGL